MSRDSSLTSLLIKRTASASLTPYLCVLGAFVIHFSIGSLQYTFGNLLPYIASYLASNDGNTREDYNRYNDSGTWIYVARAVTFVFGNMLAAKLHQRLGGRIAILIGSAIISGSIALSYFSAHSLGLMILTYGATSGVGCGICYILAMTISMKWFPQNEAFIAGVVLSGYGVSGVVFNIVITRFINPQNIELDPDTGFLNEDDVLNNIPDSFWKVGLIYFAMQIIAILLIKEAPSINTGSGSYKDSVAKCAVEQPVEGMKSEKETSSEINMSLLSDHSDHHQIHHQKDNKITATKGIDETNYNVNRYRYWWYQMMVKYDCLILTEGIFWNLWFTNFFAQLVSIYTSSQWKTFSNQHLGINDDSVLSYMGSISSIANALGRLFWGFFRDRIGGYMLTMGTIVFMEGIVLATWSLIGFIFEGELVLTIAANVWLFMLFFCGIGRYNVMVQRCSEIWGIDKVNWYHSILMSNQIPSAVAVPFVIAAMRDSLGWVAMSMLMAGFQIVTFCIVLSSKFHQFPAKLY